MEARLTKMDGDDWAVEIRDHDDLVFDFNGPLDVCISWIQRICGHRLVTPLT
jgi:hypothetical protein